MILEAVWLKNGKEIAWCDPVISVDTCDIEQKGIAGIFVFNGYDSYGARDCDCDPDDFIVRVKNN